MSDTGALSSRIGSEIDGWPTNGPFTRTGLWFWIVIAVGAALRFYFVFFTLGTTDVNIWDWHAHRVHDVGVLEHYRDQGRVDSEWKEAVTFPPFILTVESLCRQAADRLGITFRILLRLPFAILDGGTAFLLVLLLRGHPARFVIASAYWLSPLAMIFSAYHGNTDSAIAFFLLLCCVLLRDEKIALAALTLGISVWVKLPGVLAIPALFFFINGWRRRLLFLLLTALTALIGFLPALEQDPQLVLGHVFGYHGEPLYTVLGFPIWGLRLVLFWVIHRAAQWREAIEEPILFFLRHSWQIAIVLLLVFVWLRRSRRSVADLAATIAGSYVILYAFIDTWAFQYLAWSLPFWFFLPRLLSIPMIVLASSYIYGLYWFFCGNGWLLGEWDFGGHFNWPLWLLGLRNTTFLFFLVSACLLLGRAALQQFPPSSENQTPA